MDVQQLLRRHRSNWRELEELLANFNTKKSRVSSDQILRLTHLYKQAASHLSLMQSRYPTDEITGYLNGLVTRSHHILYHESNRSGRQLSSFLGTYLIDLLRKRMLFTLLAAALLTLGLVSGFAAVAAEPSRIYDLLPQEMAGYVDPARTGQGLESAPHAIISTQIMTNNIRVAVLAFASGITFGIFTVYLLAYNGLLVGALAAVYWRAGESYLFWAYILPHGVIELTAIFIAGGAGLYMGYRMFVPGPYPWKLQLLRSAKESVQLLLATVPLFIIAGIIEGFITPSSLSLEAKYAFAGLTLLLLVAYYAAGILLSRSKSKSTPSI